MEILVDVPDALAARLGASGAALSKAAFHALAIDAYRRGRLSGFELRDLLELPTRDALDDLLKEHGVPLEYTLAEWDDERATVDRIREARKADTAR